LAFWSEKFAQPWSSHFQSSRQATYIGDDSSLAEKTEYHKENGRTTINPKFIKEMTERKRILEAICGSLVQSLPESWSDVIVAARRSAMSPERLRSVSL
jgi:hypothetical protein